LDLYSSDIDDDGMEHLAGALPQLSSLKELYLGHNRFGVNGMRHLATALVSVATLQLLNVEWMRNIGAAGAQLRAGVLPRLSSLQELYFDECNIGVIGMHYIAVALQHLLSLVTLYINGNGIGADGAKSLISALEVNTSLTLVMVCDHTLDNWRAGHGCDNLDDYLDDDDDNDDDDDDEEDSNKERINVLLRRNRRLWCMFLFDARQMLLSVMCADWCGVVWSFYSGDTKEERSALAGDVGSMQARYEAGLETLKEDDGEEAPSDLEALRAVHAGIVDTRRRRIEDSNAAAPSIAFTFEWSFPEYGGRTCRLVLE
jgi:hypothetical protein